MKRKNLFIYVLLAMALLAVALPLSGCATTGKTVSTAAATTAGGAGAKNEIIIVGNAFKPDSLTIKVGDTVTWINNESYAHTVRAKNGEFDSGHIESGAKFSFTFDKEGTYDYICGIHTFMTGKIVVTK
jgi:plastocyanin